MDEASSINTNHWPHTYYKWEAFKKCKDKYIYFELKFSGLHDLALTIEYLIPLSKDGADDISNVYPCCKNCNTHQGSLPYIRMDRFAKIKKKYAQRYLPYYQSVR